MSVENLDYECFTVKNGKITDEGLFDDLNNIEFDKYLHIKSVYEAAKEELKKREAQKHLDELYKDLIESFK